MIKVQIRHTNSDKYGDQVPGTQQVPIKHTETRRFDAKAIDTVTSLTRDGKEYTHTDTAYVRPDDAIQKWAAGATSVSEVEGDGTYYLTKTFDTFISIKEFDGPKEVLEYLCNNGCEAVERGDGLNFTYVIWVWIE